MSVNALWLGAEDYCGAERVAAAIGDSSGALTATDADSFAVAQTGAESPGLTLGISRDTIGGNHALRWFPAVI